MRKLQIPMYVSNTFCRNFAVKSRCSWAFPVFVQWYRISLPTSMARTRYYINYKFSFWNPPPNFRHFSKHFRLRRLRKSRSSIQDCYTILRTEKYSNIPISFFTPSSHDLHKTNDFFAFRLYNYLGICFVCLSYLSNQTTTCKISHILLLWFKCVKCLPLFPGSLKHGAIYNMVTRRPDPDKYRDFFTAH